MGLLLAARPCFGILNASSQTYKLACASETAGMHSDTKQQASTTSAESEDTSQWWGIFRNTTPNQTVGQERGCPVLRWTKKNMTGNPEMKSTQFFLHKINSCFEVVNSSFALLLFTPKNGDLKGISNENVASDFIMALSQIVLHGAMGMHPLDGKSAPIDSRLDELVELFVIRRTLIEKLMIRIRALIYMFITSFEYFIGSRLWGSERLLWTLKMLWTHRSKHGCPKIGMKIKLRP